jgi:hypothetical protein
MDGVMMENGQYIGNRLASALDFLDEDYRTARDNYVIGEPQDCDLGKANELKRQGFVGLYRRFLESEQPKHIIFKRSRRIE